MDPRTRELVKLSAASVVLDELARGESMDKRAASARDLVDSIKRRGFGLKLTRGMGLAFPPAAMGATALGVSALIPALALTILASPFIMDSVERSHLKKTKGKEEGRELANLSQRGYNKKYRTSRLLDVFGSRFGLYPLSIVSLFKDPKDKDIEEAAKQLLRQVRLGVVDPGDRPFFGPLSTST